MAGIITETEAYMGVTDKASHAYMGRRTARTETMYLPGGYAYVYLIYGIYSCMNITANENDNPEAVLIRGVLPVLGFEIMLENHQAFTSARRKGETVNVSRYEKAPHTLTDGPGKLCAAMKIDRTLDKAPMFPHETDIPCQIFVSAPPFSADFTVSASPRIGIPYAEEAALFPWRFTASFRSQKPTIV